MRLLPLFLLGTLLTGCGGSDGFDDLRQFMEQEGKKNAPKVAPLPPPKPHDTFVFEADQVADPFNPRSLKGGQVAEEETVRPRGTLEDYPLEGLRVTGVIERSGIFQALIATPNGRLYLTKTGDRIGQNKGVVVEVSYKGVKVKERIMSAPGKWNEIISELSKPQDTDIRELKRDSAGQWSNPN